MSRRSKFFPGWKMTWSQHHAYFSLLDRACRAQGKTSAAGREELRKTIHEHAFGRPVSAKEIDHLTMFDTFKAECLALSRPDDMEAQLRQVNQPLIRLRHACRRLADEPYIDALVRSARFKKRSLDDDDWTEEQLTELRNTLAARASAHQRKEKEETAENPF